MRSWKTFPELMTKIEAKIAVRYFYIDIAMSIGGFLISDGMP